MEEHLKELLRNTPSSRSKLLSAWDGLSIETQIKLLHALADGGRLHLSFHRDVITKALKSPNEYIRYLAARSHDLHEDIEMIEQIAADESPLVRYAQEEVKFHTVPSIITPGWIEKFFDFPKAKQLAVARAQHPPSSGAFAEFLMCAVRAKGTPPEELSELLSEYLNNPEVKKKSLGHEDLWKIVPEMPEGIARSLVMDLAAEFGTEEIISSTVLYWLHGDLLCMFLSRADVELRDFRRGVFLSIDEKYSDAERIAAASTYLDLSFNQFHSLLKEHSPRLEMLACPGKHSPVDLLWPGVFKRPLPLYNLRLVFLECLKDYFEYQEHVGQCNSEPQHRCRSMLEHKLEQLQEKLPGKLTYREKRDVFYLKIYRLAKIVMPWGGRKDEGELGGPLKFLAGKIVEGDTWATFMAFDESIGEGLHSVEWCYRYYRYLPVLEELGEIDPNIVPGVDNLKNLFGIEIARTGESQVSNSVTPSAPDWFDWAVSILRRLFR